MGDRGNIAIVQDVKTEDGEKVCIYFYTHHSGSELPQILKDALVRGKDRWDDSPYLSRIIFSEMIKDYVMGTTGYGISTEICDNNHEIIYVDPNHQEVYIDEDSWTFEEFINLDLSVLEDF